MNCEDVQAGLLDLARSGRPLPGAAAQHVAQCPACRETWEDVTGAMTALDALTPVRMPEAVANAVRRRVLRDLAARPILAAAGRAGLFGLVAALASLAILSYRLELRDFPVWVVATGGLAWLAVFVIAFWMVLRPRPGADNLRALVRNGLGAMAVFLVADQFLPLTSVVDFCFRNSWAREHLGALGVQGVFFVVGSAYAMIPLFLLSWSGGRRYRNGAFKGGVTAAVMFFFLLAPAIFIQCHAFTIGALLAWSGGAIAGSVVGGVAGYWVARRATH